ncbi:MAG TPA: large-conductance mechanosensitive channel protein MscL [Christensenellaceae bacterium]|jgi:large conductance mechanosensitive channel|nr:large-conductance mechanosensitive channel protein MscL [Christensenellaceae bacterium]
MKEFIDEFKAFAVKGNVIDMAVGVIIGGAFGKIVSSLVNDIFMPIVSLITGGINVSGLFIQLGGGDVKYPSISAAQDAGVATFNYGLFLQNVIDFVLIALCIFLFVRAINSLKKPKEEAPKSEARSCPYCFENVADKATRCPHCTSELPSPDKA